MLATFNAIQVAEQVYGQEGSALGSSKESLPILLKSSCGARF